MSSDQDDLDTYLNNHAAGGTGAIEMAEHCEAANAGEPVAQFLATLVADIKADHQTLTDLMDALGTTRNPVKKMAARVGEKLTHLNLEGGDLGNLLTLEALSLGVEGKACMWKSLEKVRDSSDVFAAVDFHALIKRAENQRAGIEEWRLAVATVALSKNVTD
ncbi:MAG: hypothetical protein M3Z84_04240 [Actinomycetota bacterium]|nr:hypothetical protein [Actinomycetota bacterium]